MAKLDPRRLMELAIAVMRQSTAEVRGDGKKCPKVGAVLWKPNGAVEQACRGELRDGDHAEFTLIERKNRDQNLIGSVLFATLEPCAPEARNPPKLGCAQRIVAARIKEVWIGVEDPDPTVDRKGIKYLQENGVTVHMFDRDLQLQILEENSEFIEQAKERATEHTRTPKAVKLSTLEEPVATAALDDLSDAALERYRTAAGITDAIGSERFHRRLLRHGLLKDVGGEPVPTGVGLILFGKEPRSFLRQAGLLGTIHYPDGTIEPREFDGPLVLIPEQVEEWLRGKLPSVIDRGQMQRRTSAALPFETVREAVVNALVHRNYDIPGAKCQLVVTPDTVIVRSPGAPVSPITLKQMQEFNAPMLSRNPELHYVFAKLGLAEERGLGLQTFKAAGQQLPLPKYSFDDPYLGLTLFRNPTGAVRSLEAFTLGSLSAEEREGWDYISTLPSISNPDYSKHFGFNEAKSLRHLKKFVTLNLLEKTGSGRATRYIRR